MPFKSGQILKETIDQHLRKGSFEPALLIRTLETIIRGGGMGFLQPPGLTRITSR
jgi:hypothetical protein